MPLIDGVLKRSILSSISPEEEIARKNELLNIDNPLKRITALALHELAIHFPDQIAPHVGLGARSDSEHAFVGAGFDALVFRDNNSVIKVHKKTIGLSEAEQVEIATERNAVHTKMRTAMPQFTLSQESTVGHHPHYPEVAATVTLQAFQPDIADTDLFYTESDILNPSAFQDLTRKPGLVSQLSAFVTISQYLRVNEGLTPDIKGKGNLVTTAEGQLLMIDGQPLLGNEQDVWAREASIARLAILETALATAA